MKAWISVSKLQWRAALLATTLLLAAPLALRAQTPHVAVLDFRQETPVAYEHSAGLEDFFEIALQKRDVPVLERRNIRLVLAERNLNGGLLSADTLSQAKLPSVNYFINGQVAFPNDREFTLTLSIIRADRSTVESAITRRGYYPGDWLASIEALAGDVASRLHLPKQLNAAQRSQFEAMTWLPEAALPFFKGLEFYGHGDFAGSVPWFRDSYGKDKHFDMARQWEARAYRKLDLPQLANVWSSVATNATARAANSKRTVAAVVASEKIPASARAAFVQALAQKEELELFDPASIGATAREVDLQLTGQMETPLNERSVWLVVDDMIYIDVPETQTLVARQQNLLSGKTIKQAKIKAAAADDVNCAALAAALLAGEKSASVADPGTNGLQSMPEPGRMEPAETGLPKALRIAQAHPESAKCWVGLADAYGGDRPFKSVCLDQAIGAIERNREQPDAVFWLTSALWRKRDMTRRIYHDPDPQLRAPNRLTNDFVPLFQWFPKSGEAASLAERTNHGEGKYTLVDPADPKYLSPVYTNWIGRNFDVRVPSRGPKYAPQPFTDEQCFARLSQFMKEGRTAPAWALANVLLRSGKPSVQTQAKPAFDKLLDTAVSEHERFNNFKAAVAAGEPQRIIREGETLLKCFDRRERAEVIKQCSEAIKKQRGDQLKFLFEQASQYRNDFLLDPLTGAPGNNKEFQLLENSRLVQPVIVGDYGYEPIMGTVAELAASQPASELTKEIFVYIRNDWSLPLEKQLTAAYDLAILEQARGNTFEALDQLKELLRQTEGTGLPLRRNNIWSQSIQEAAFDALLRLRIYADSDLDLGECCGKIAAEAPQKPVNFEEIDRKIHELWAQRPGMVTNSAPPIDAQLMADKDALMRVVIYKLSAGQEEAFIMSFCADLGTNALPALPYIARIIQRGGPFPAYNNAILALGSLGSAAACAKPLLILAQEKEDNGNFASALRGIGPAPRRVVPQLARLLFHKNPDVCKRAAKAMLETAGSELRPYQDLADAQQVAQLRTWWEQTGAAAHWN